MAVNSTIRDGTGSKQRLKVYEEGAVGVVVHSHPPIGEEIEGLPFSQFFTTDGTSTGTSSMLVNGSTTPQEFFIAAQADKDVYIKTISIRIADQSAVLNKYGNIAALTNGLTWKYRNTVIGDYTIKSGIKTNLDFIRLGLSTPAVGDGATAFRTDVSGSNAETYLIIIDLAQTFGMTWGLRLGKGTTDRISFVVNDDISTIDGQDIIGFGIQI